MPESKLHPKPLMGAGPERQVAHGSTSGHQVRVRLTSLSLGLGRAIAAPPRLRGPHSKRDLGGPSVHRPAVY